MALQFEPQTRLVPVVCYEKFITQTCLLYPTTEMEFSIGQEHVTLRASNCLIPEGDKSFNLGLACEQGMWPQTMVET